MSSLDEKRGFLDKRLFSLVVISAIFVGIFLLGNVIADSSEGGACAGATRGFICGDTITESCILTGDLTSEGNCFKVEADSIIIDCAGHSIVGIGKDSGYGFYLNNTNNSEIKSCILSSFSDGFYLSGSSNNTFSNNIISNNTKGFYLESLLICAPPNCNPNKLGVGRVPRPFGSQVYSSSNNSFFNNVLSNNEYGFYLSSSPSNSFSENTLSNNEYGFYLSFSPRNSFSESNSFSNNRVCGASSDGYDFYFDSFSISNIGSENVCDKVFYKSPSSDFSCEHSCSDNEKVKKNDCVVDLGGYCSPVYIDNSKDLEGSCPEGQFCYSCSEGHKFDSNFNCVLEETSCFSGFGFSYWDLGSNEKEWTYNSDADFSEKTFPCDKHSGFCCPENFVCEKSGKCVLSPNSLDICSSLKSRKTCDSNPEGYAKNEFDLPFFGIFNFAFVLVVVALVYFSSHERQTRKKAFSCGRN